MSVFDVNFNVLVKQLLPVRLREAITYAWLKCLVAPQRYVYTLFMNNRAANLYMLAHNGQVCYLEAVLNDLFDAEQRRIFISDPAFFDPVYIYLDAEEKPVPIYLDSEASPVPLYTESELYTGNGTSFIVNVPAILGLTAGQLTRLRALVNKYKLPARVYIVVIF